MLFWLLQGFILFDFLVDKGLEYLNVKHWSDNLPREALDFYDQASYKKAKEYQLTNTRFSVFTSGFFLVLTLAVFQTKALGNLQYIIESNFNHPIIISLIFLGILGLAISTLNIPFSWYHTFVIEERFEFNRTTPKLFWIDWFKQLLLSAFLGGIIMASVEWIYLQIPDYFWFIAASVLSLFTLFFATFYTSLLLPIFNQLKPLESGTLLDKIKDYCHQVSFPLSRIYILDGSKRSNKANAFFSGLGKKKAIVLYNTLITEHSEEEVVAILAHEVGHYKKKHIRAQLLLGALHMYLICALLGAVLKSPDIGKAMGLSSTPFHIALIGFSILYGPVSMVMNIGMMWISRRFEFEADAYAKNTYQATLLMDGLKRLSVKHLSNLTPHPWYVFFHYSHPPLLARLKALE